MHQDGAMMDMGRCAYKLVVRRAGGHGQGDGGARRARSTHQPAVPALARWPCFTHTLRWRRVGLLVKWLHTVVTVDGERSS